MIFGKILKGIIGAILWIGLIYFLFIAQILFLLFIWLPLPLQPNMYKRDNLNTIKKRFKAWKKDWIVFPQLLDMDL